MINKTMLKTVGLTLLVLTVINRVRAAEPVKRVING